MKAIRKILIAALVMLTGTVDYRIVIGNNSLPPQKARVFKLEQFWPAEAHAAGKPELIEELLTLYKKIDSLPFYMCSGTIDQYNSEDQSKNRNYNFLYCKNGTGHYFDTEENELLKLKEVQFRLDRRSKSLDMLPPGSAFPDFKIDPDTLRLLLKQKNIAVGKVLVDGIVTLAILGSIGDTKHDIVVKYDPEAVRLKSINWRQLISLADKAIDRSTHISMDSWQQREPPAALFNIRNYFSEYPASLHLSDKLHDYIFTDRRLENNSIPSFDLFQCFSNKGGNN